MITAWFLSSVCRQAIFDTDSKQEYATIVPHCTMSSIEASHSQSVSDLLWIPDHFEVSRYKCLLH